jgi:hypothetical protein
LTGITEVPVVKTFTVSSAVVTRDGSKISDADVVMSDGISSFSYKSAADGSAQGTLTTESNVSVQVGIANDLPSGFISPPIGTIVTQALVDYFNTSTNKTFTVNTGGYTVPDDWTQGIPENSTDYTPWESKTGSHESKSISSQDALDALKLSVGLTKSEQSKWVFVDSNGDYSSVSKSNTNYTEGVSIADLSADLSVSLTGILIGDVNDSYSGLVA